MTETVKTEKLLLQKDGPIGWIIFNQPEKRNAVSQEMWQAMPEYVADLAADPAIRVVILRGAGEAAFVAGADISQFKDRRRNAADEEEYRRISGAGSESLARLGKPLVAMIQGFCIGGGVSIAITCDLRIAADDARFALPEPKVGVSIDAGGDLRLIAEIGAGWTKLLAFTGRRIDAETALRLGIVQEVVPRDVLREHVRALGLEIAANAPLAVQGIKRTINYRAQQGLAEALRFEAASAAPLFTSDDMALGYKAMAAKQTPEFEGK